jgi:hypothetical protein
MSMASDRSGRALAPGQRRAVRRVLPLAGGGRRGPANPGNEVVSTRGGVNSLTSPLGLPGPHELADRRSNFSDRLVAGCKLQTGIETCG